MKRFIKEMTADFNPVFAAGFYALFLIIIFLIPFFLIISIHFFPSFFTGWLLKWNMDAIGFFGKF